MMRGINNNMCRQAIAISIMLFLLTSPFLSCTGGTTTPQATINKTSGQVLLQKSGTSAWESASAGTTLQIGDHIRTQTDSSAVIVFFDGSVTTLMSDTEIIIEEMEKESGFTTVKLREEMGSTASRVEKLVDPRSQFEIETPAGSAVVRGSVMGVMVLLNGTTIVDAIAGQCWARAQGVEVLLTEGMRTIIYIGRPPSNPAVPTTTSTIPPSNPSQAPAFFNIEPYEPPVEPLEEEKLPPQVTTDGCAIIFPPMEDRTDLRLIGTLTSMGTASEVAVSFEFGISPGIYPYTTPPQTMAATGSFHFDIVDIWSYEFSQYLYFRAKADGGIHGISYGAEKACDLYIEPQ